MNKPTFYEQAGIIIPGAVLLVGLLFYFPALNALMAKDGVSLGQFGIFLLLAYAAGHSSPLSATDLKRCSGEPSAACRLIG
jgi:hypothetical protein